MIQVEKDIEAAINIINSKKVNLKEYNAVNLFPKYSLKTFKKYKLDKKNVLTKLNSHAEVFDLISYGSNVSCYSYNRLDEYFLYLQCALFNLGYKEYFSYFFGNYRGYKIFSLDTYNKVKDNLDDKTRIFFDELYKYMGSDNIFNTKLCDISNYDYENLIRFVRYFLNSKYYKVSENLKNNKPKFILCKDCSIPLYFEDDTFDFINLSYDIAKMDNKEIKYIKDNIRLYFIKLLKENGKIQAFTSKNDIDIKNYKKLETRAIDDPNSPNETCKKDYAYVYRKEIIC